MEIDVFYCQCILHVSRKDNCKNNNYTCECVCRTLILSCKIFFEEWNVLLNVLLLTLTLLCRYKKGPVINLIHPFIPDSKNGVMTIFTLRYDLARFYFYFCFYISYLLSFSFRIMCYSIWINKNGLSCHSMHWSCDCQPFSFGIYDAINVWGWKQVLMHLGAKGQCKSTKAPRMLWVRHLRLRTCLLHSGMHFLRWKAHNKLGWLECLLGFLNL